MTNPKYVRFTTAGTKKKNEEVASKICLRCKETKKLSDFYQNRDWNAQAGHDAWCKECVTSYSVNRDTLKEYCWYNNRKWSDEYFEKSQKKARYTLSSDPTYVHASDAKKSKMMDQMTVRHFFQFMNLASQYIYSENMTDAGDYVDYDPESNAGALVRNQEDEPEEMTYSHVWNGKFTQRELDYLDNYYAELEEGFVLDNKSIKDYARKVAKASLSVDIASSDYRKGKIQSKELKEALDMFDNLSKSANFAACKRRAGDQGGLGSFGE